MARTDDDTWGITEGVGATALGVAAGRAAETNSADPLIRDPYAQMFLEAAGEGIWNLHDRDEVPPELAGLDPRFEERMTAMRGYIASRTLFFDDFFLSAAGDGVKQAVILAAGLDARGWRLDWAPGCVVYELDQPKVLDFKVTTLRSHSVTPLATHVCVPVDLRHDWPAALRAAGFDPTMPAAWSAEGLLPYLPADGQELLFERIEELSAPGSRLAVEAFTAEFFSSDSMARRKEQAERYREVAAKMGRTQAAGPDNLLFEEARTDVVDRLSEHGWTVTATTAEDLMERNGRSAPADLEAPFPQTVFVEARWE